MLLTIPRCFDSHVHLMGTGELLSQIDLRGMKSPHDLDGIKSRALNQRGEWILGFGWDQSLWETQDDPHFKFLDHIWPYQAVCLSRVDGHAAWLNSKALQLIINSRLDLKEELQSGLVQKDSQGKWTGLFFETAKTKIETLIPPPSNQDCEKFIFAGSQEFLRKGITHIRDMSGDIQQWNAIVSLDHSRQFSLYVDQYFFCQDLKAVKEAIEFFRKGIFSQPGPHLRFAGIKIFVDGSLGSETAFLSQAYSDKESCGSLLWDKGDFKAAVQTAWKFGLPIAVHAIGDEANHFVATSCLEVVREKTTWGQLHLEHAQILRFETIEILKQLSVTCHFQPVHWMSDKRWLQRKVPQLFESLFPWQKVEAAGIPFFWGSDSPVESAGIFQTKEALGNAECSGIHNIQQNWWMPHSHSEIHWGPLCESVFDETGQLVRLTVDGDVLS